MNIRTARSITALVLVGGLLAPAWCGAVDNVALHALSRDKAIVLIDGKRRVLRSGEASPEGVTLIGTDTRAETAEIEIDGKGQVLRLGVVISGFASSGKGKVTLYPDGSHYHADGFINGAPVRFLVDTGATHIAISGQVAGRLGLDYKRVGRPGLAQTAGGIVRTWSLTLERVQVGDITLFNVDAGVIEGSFPIEPLLGMSFLGQLDMKREADRLELSQR